MTAENFFVKIVGKLSCFYVHVCIESPTLGHKTVRMMSAVDVDVIIRETGDGVGVWSGLRAMENTAALKYQWPQSHCNDLLLRAINIDARNIVSRSRAVL